MVHGRLPAPRGAEGARRTVVYGLVSWFLLDSAGSAASGNWANVGFNVLVLLLAVGPLWRSAKPAGNGATIGR